LRIKKFESLFNCILSQHREFERADDLSLSITSTSDLRYARLSGILHLRVQASTELTAQRYHVNLAIQYGEFYKARKLWETYIADYADFLKMFRMPVDRLVNVHEAMQLKFDMAVT